MNDEQITQMCSDVAREAWRSMNQAYKDFADVNDACDDCDINLYVYGNGSWTIDGAQYLTDHRDIVAVVPIAPFNGPVELADAIEQEFDDTYVQPGDEA